MSNYECTQDVLEHRRLVGYYMSLIAAALVNRAATHDNSKLLPPEKQVFDIYTPKLKTLVYGSPEYKAALSEMGEALQAHYRANDHHPEHFEEGVSGMNIVQVVEMICDWAAASQKNNNPVPMQIQSKRFSLDEMLTSIFRNTYAWMDKYKHGSMTALGDK